MSQTHLAGGALFTSAGFGAAVAGGVVHPPGWALAGAIAWGALAGELPDIDHRRARVSRGGVAFGVAGWLLGLPARIVGRVIRALRVRHRGPTHSLAFLALWATLAAPLYLTLGAAVVLALAWALGKLAVLAHLGVRVSTPAVLAWLRAGLPVIYPYAVASTALGYLSHLVLDSLTGPIPWGWPLSARRVSLLPEPLRIGTGSRVEAWLVRPAITIAVVIAVAQLAGLPHPR